MSDHRIRDVIIVGGGTAGWMAAAALVNKFGGNGFTRITLVDTPEIATVGVGEATVPTFRTFLSTLHIKETDFVRKCNATFKLAIAFDGWAGEGTRFFHPFAEHGLPIQGVGFHHLWTRLRHEADVRPLDNYCLASQLAQNNRFALPRKSDTGQYLFNYAFHFDAQLVAQYFKSWAITHGVTHIEGKVTDVALAGLSGDVEALLLEDGRKVTGDLFVDCSGFRALLIEGALKTGYESWSDWLPCDSALAMPTQSAGKLASYTRSLACSAGWQWRIPLQNRVGNGYVYSRAFVDDARASEELAGNIQGSALAEPRIIRFLPGLRKKIWNRNVYALGLAAGFLEPLESTSLYLVQSAIQALINNFPTRNVPQALRDEVNRRNIDHQRHLRDFIILHYALNQRHGEAFWDYCRNMSLPESLVDQIRLFNEAGRIQKGPEDFFQYSSWLSVFLGLGVVPRYAHPSAYDFALADLQSEVSAMERGIQEAVTASPDHFAFIESNCSSQHRPVEAAGA